MMQPLFDKPQRQSSLGVVILFFDTAYQYGRAFGPLLFLYIIKFDTISKLAVFGSVLVLILFIALIAYLKYINFTFFLDHLKQEFVIKEGIFNKTSTTVQLQKIQQVNIKQNLIQRIINVYALEVDTAGSSEQEGKIKAISHELAIELKAALLRNKSIYEAQEDEPIVNTVSDPSIEPVLKISILSLLKMGITSNYVKSFSLLLVFFFTLLDYLEKVFGEEIYDGEHLEKFIPIEVILQSLLFIVLFFVLLIVVINLVRILLKYFDFTIQRQSGSLLLSFGLINTNSTIVKPEKVQITAISRNYFQRKFDVLELKIKQATQGEKREQKTSIEIPGCNEQEKDNILQLIFKKIPERGVMLTPNFRKLVFAMFLTLVLPLVGYFSIRANLPTFDYHYDYFLPVYIAFVGLVQYFKFRNSRLFINDEFIIFQSGAWDVSNEIIEPNRIQAITTSQLFWHKSLNIGSITLHTAGGDLSFQLGNYNTIKQYVNLWLYRLEKSDSNWM